jgi:hypothetical protein
MYLDHQELICLWGLLQSVPGNTPYARAKARSLKYGTDLDHRYVQYSTVQYRRAFELFPLVSSKAFWRASAMRDGIKCTVLMLPVHLRRHPQGREAMQEVAHGSC